MTLDRVRLAFHVKIRPSVAAQLLIDQKLPSLNMTSVSDMTPLLVEVEIVMGWKAIYVSRPSERIVAYTGPCGEPDCDGMHVVGYTSREPDHAPDAMVAEPTEIRWDGSSMDPRFLREVLEKCEQEPGVDVLRTALDKLRAPW